MNCPQILTERRNTTAKSLKNKEVNFSHCKISVSNLIVTVKSQKMDVSKKEKQGMQKKKSK